MFQRMVRRSQSGLEQLVSDVETFLRSAPLDLETLEIPYTLETRSVGDALETFEIRETLAYGGLRFGCAIGDTDVIIAVSRDLGSEQMLADAVRETADFVIYNRDYGLDHCVGVISDGMRWHCCHAVDGEIRLVSSIECDDSEDSLDRLVVCLQGFLPTTTPIRATASNIARYLGAGSPSYELDRDKLRAIYERHRENPTVVVRRTVWARMLTSALGVQFTDDDSLFVEHTLLVNTASIMAEEILYPGKLGKTEETDLFNWVSDLEHCQEADHEFFYSFSQKLFSRFDWRDAEQDVLKVLLESMMGAETRQALRDNNTPDWLARRVVDEVIRDSLNTRVLDPACGSGIFLFCAVRKYLAAADCAGIPNHEALDGLANHVLGLELHPVAVALAKVGYLMAIGRERLREYGIDFHIPVYLGDSLQWQEQQAQLVDGSLLVDDADDRRELIAPQLSFPDQLLSDASRFCMLVDVLAKMVTDKKRGFQVPQLPATFNRLGIKERHRELVSQTFRTMCRLTDEGRDHIWKYQISNLRNLARPMWLQRSNNKVDVLIGKPPWLAFRHMTETMQRAFQASSEQRDLWFGGESAADQDLCGLFLVRCCELYLNHNGGFGFVLPTAALDQEHYQGLRSGYCGDATGQIALAFSGCWDLRRVDPPFLPFAPCVVFGSRSHSPGPLAAETEIWSGSLTGGDDPTLHIVREQRGPPHLIGPVE